MFAFHNGCPAAGTVVNERVAGIAGEDEVVDIGGAVLAVVADVMRRAQTRRRVATGAGAAAQGGDQCQALRRGRQPSHPPQM